jgi:GntR family transcriptional regulator, transcriptional repressor for pyruvate dehydrogenase complex
MRRTRYDPSRSPGPTSDSEGRDRAVTADSRNPTRRRLRQPRLADLIADDLRDRILTSEIADGGLLPKQDQLIADFGVSMPSIREALRILETEGLVTVLRGNVGGAEVRLPHAGKVAYMIALVLQSRGVAMDDVAESLRQLEPLCAAMAARRDDRHDDVVPTLRARIEASVAAYDDDDEYVRHARLFHEELVAGCGNETMILMCGALESLWSAHVDHLTRRTAQHEPFTDPAFRSKSVSDHELLVDAIDRGDAEAAEAIAREHFSQPERHGFMVDGGTVMARLLRHE